jgi:hypothetical protein
MYVLSRVRRDFVALDVLSWRLWRVGQGKKKYFVHWKGYGDDANSWVGAEDFVEPDALKVLLEKMRKKQRDNRAVRLRRM